MAMPDKDNGSLTVCETCMHHCALKEGKTRICGARKNVEGRILDINYGPDYFYGTGSDRKKSRCACSVPEARSFCRQFRMQSGSALSVRTTKSHAWTKAVLGAPYNTRGTGGNCSPTEKQGSIGIAYTYNEPLVGWGICAGYFKTCRIQGP